MVAVCEKMGWDYFIYNEQPQWFIDLIIAKMNLDAKHLSQQMRKGKRK